MIIFLSFYDNYFYAEKNPKKSYGNTFLLYFFCVVSISVSKSKKTGFFIKVFSYFKNGQNKMSKFHFSKYFLDFFCY